MRINLAYLFIISMISTLPAMAETNYTCNSFSTFNFSGGATSKIVISNTNKKDLVAVDEVIYSLVDASESDVEMDNYIASISASRISKVFRTTAQPAFVSAIAIKKTESGESCHIVSIPSKGFENKVGSDFYDVTRTSDLSFKVKSVINSSTTFTHEVQFNR